MPTLATPIGDHLQSPLSLYRPEEWPEVLSVAQVAHLFAVHPNVVRRAISRQELDGVLVGGQWRIAAPSVWPLVPVSIRAHWPEGPWNELDEDQEDPGECREAER